MLGCGLNKTTNSNDNNPQTVAAAPRESKVDVFEKNDAGQVNAKVLHHNVDGRVAANLAVLADHGVDHYGLPRQRLEDGVAERRGRPLALQNLALFLQPRQNRVV